MHLNRLQRFVRQGLLLSSALGITLATVAQSLNLLSNGSFEEAAFEIPGWVVRSSDGYPARIGTAYRPYIEYIGGRFEGTDGDVSVGFNGGQGQANAIISQVIRTTPGTRYSLEFDYGVTYSGYNDSVTSPPPGQSLLVSLAGGTWNGTNWTTFQQTSALLDYSAYRPALPTTVINGYITYVAPATIARFSFSFVADQEATRLTFEDAPGNPTLNEDSILDRVSITAVPEPGAVSLNAGLAVLAFSIVHRRVREKTCSPRLGRQSHGRWETRQGRPGADDGGPANAPAYGCPTRMQIVGESQT